MIYKRIFAHKHKNLYICTQIVQINKMTKDEKMVY